MWMPREPDVFGKPRRPCSSSTSRTPSATSRTSENGTSGCGSRSTRSSSGWSRSLRRTAHGFQSITPRLTPQTRCAASFGTSSRAWRPLGKVDRRGLQPLGRAVGHALLEERLALDAVDPALHHRRTVAQTAYDRLGALQVVVDEVELRQPALGKERLARAAHAQLASGDLDNCRLSLLRSHCWKDDR